MSIEKLGSNDANRAKISIRKIANAIVSIMEPFRYFLRKIFSDKYLLATNLTLGFVISSLSDILEQQIEHYSSSTKDLVSEKKNWDITRTRNMGLAGCLVELICHYWYQFLDRHMPERTLKVVFKKILLDLLICAPIYITAFFVLLGILDNESVQVIWTDLKTKAVRVYMTEWIIWTPAQFINFYYISPKYRVVYDCLISFGYDMYTSRVKYGHIDYRQGEPSIFIDKIQRSLFTT